MSRIFGKCDPFKEPQNSDVASLQKCLRKVLSCLPCTQYLGSSLDKTSDAVEESSTDCNDNGLFEDIPVSLGNDNVLEDVGNAEYAVAARKTKVISCM